MNAVEFPDFIVGAVLSAHVEPAQANQRRADGNQYCRSDNQKVYCAPQAHLGGSSVWYFVALREIQRALRIQRKVC